MSTVLPVYCASLLLALLSNAVEYSGGELVAVSDHPRAGTNHTTIQPPLNVTAFDREDVENNRSKRAAAIYTGVSYWPRNTLLYVIDISWYSGQGKKFFFDIFCFAHALKLEENRIFSLIKSRFTFYKYCSQRISFRSFPVSDVWIGLVLTSGALPNSSQQIACGVLFRGLGIWLSPLTCVLRSLSLCIRLVVVFLHRS